MKKFLVMFLIMGAIQCASTTGAAAQAVVREDLSRYFGGLTGAFVLYEPATDTYKIYNEAQSNKRLSPCSSFKIFNSLIGLETGVLDRDDALTRLPWDGTRHDIAGWNRDHTLSSATRESVVWYFQALATKIGADRMQLYLDRIGYGNRDISGGLTRFWLRSSLKISAMEQVDLLSRLYAGQLPFSAESRAIVLKNITLLDENGVKFMGKTGSGYQDGKWIFGWFVGYIETQGKVYVFATNVEGEDEASGVKAREITRAIAKDMGLL